MGAGYYQRKFHLRYKLSDGNIWKGFINVEADTREELYTMDNVKGTFWVEKIPEGWLGTFELDNGPSDRRKGGHTDYRFVITVGVFTPDEELGSQTGLCNSTADAERILSRTRPIPYERIDKFSGRIEEHIVSEETHHWR
jgi:hypothetical protein